MQYSKSLQTAIITLLLLATAPTYAADTEYDAIGTNVLDSINAQAAYNQGYTGTGINVGVCDMPTNFAHPDLNGKQFDEVNTEGMTWADVDHGTHVSGIVAASKNGVGMHGVAYDAYVIAGSPMNKIQLDGMFMTKRNIFSTFLDRPEVKVINNSWGWPIYITEIDFETEEEVRNDQDVRFTYDDTVKAINADKLLVFAAGNSGHITSSLEQNLFYLYSDASNSNNLINVIAGNSKAFTKKDDGFNVDSLSTAVFADLAMFCEDSTLVAPGFMINSANANFAADGKEYVEYCGSSMSAPVVTGVGALVQQAFPYLGGKQIGDVLLSTANNKITNTDGFYLTTQEDYIGGEVQYKGSINIFFTNDKNQDAEQQKIDALTKYLSKIIKQKEYTNENMQLYYFAAILGGNKEGYKDINNMLYGAKDENLAEITKQILEKYKIDVNTYYNTPEEMIFGQGMVDAGAAVKGLGAINVRRLSKTNYIKSRR